jgi:hypothetical protein
MLFVANTLKVSIGNCRYMSGNYKSKTLIKLNTIEHYNYFVLKVLLGWVYSHYKKGKS